MTSYIRVVDYIVLTTCHQLLMSSLDDLLHMFRDVPLGYKEPAEEVVDEEEDLSLTAKKAEAAKINSYVRRRSQELDETASMAC